MAAADEITEGEQTKVGVTGEFSTICDCDGIDFRILVLSTLGMCLPNDAGCIADHMAVLALMLVAVLIKLLLLGQRSIAGTG
jgi:hypothetical protein